MPASGVKALFFDVFGTLVDWRSGVAREAESILTPLRPDMNWEGFADAWRDQYQPSMEEVRSGRLPYTKLDVLHRRSLSTVLAGFGCGDLRTATLDQLTPPAVYLAAAAAFDLKPGECMMCAAHGSDLKAAAANGLRTAFIARPQERPGFSETEPGMPVDIVADSTLDLAAQLGA
jgi:FMN phosphatase YigB (HAD superfamily)